MLEMLWLVPALPFAGFLILAFGARRLSAGAAASVGVGSVGLAAAVSIAIASEFLASPPPGHAFTQTLWQWMSVSGFEPRIALRLDPLSLAMTLVVCVVGFLIHLYSAGFMRGDDGYARFFAYMNLFVGSMLVLVLAADLLLLYLGWEGVGLCSYLLIGFWYREEANGRAAQKAFIVTRIGDTAMAIGLFLLFTRLGTLDIRTILERAPQALDPAGAALIAALLLGGALGKSAQLPLQTWLPDAMAGPTPVSALIHAATMVTAGVYLVARTHTLFEMAPPVQAAVAVIGAATLLAGAVSALFQRDIKRTLAYSTMSQVGYMFLALGVGAWAAGIFHFVTHACFKALLFLAAGGVVYALHHEQDIFRMGGLRTRLPVVFWTFLAGAAALAGLPFVTSGFYSKDWIIAASWNGPGGRWLWVAASAGALLTAAYSFRLVYRVFFGPARTEPHARPTATMRLPLVVLAVFSLVVGFLELPPAMGHVTVFGDFMAPALPHEPEGDAPEAGLFATAAIVPLAGIALAWWALRRGAGKRVAAPPVREHDAVKTRGASAGRTAGRPVAAGAPPPLRPATERPGLTGALARFFAGGWGFDALYGALFVRPFLALARIVRGEPLDFIPAAIAATARGFYRAASATQTGHVRWYAAATAFGCAVLLALVLLR